MGIDILGVDWEQIWWVKNILIADKTKIIAH